MDTISIQNTKTLEKVFTSELQQRKLLRQNRRQLLLGVFMITTIILGLYIFTPLFELINY